MDNFVTENEILDGCLLNNPIAQKKLYDTFSRTMLGFCFRYTNDNDTAQEILQKGFILVFRKLQTFKREGSLEGWIKRIMVNTALTHIRVNKSHKIDFDVEISDISHTVYSQIISDIDAKSLLSVIQFLPKGFRSIFNLHAIEGYSHVEIGEMLNISEETSKSQYMRARNRIKSLINVEVNKSTNQIVISN